MRRISANLLLVAAIAGMMCLSMASCSLFWNQDTETKETRWVAVTAVYDDPADIGGTVQRIVLIDFDEPTNYRVLARDSVTAGHRPCLSPDGRQILFENLADGLWHISLLDIETETVRGLYTGGGGTTRLPLTADLRCIWVADGSGFFGSLDYRVYHYDFDHGIRILGVGIPDGLIGTDSLMLRTDTGLAFMDSRTGNILGRLHNTHLRSEPGRSSLNPAYNAKLGLIAFELHEEAPPDAPPTGASFTSKIAITDLDGTFFDAYSSGEEFLDRDPRWGPDNTVLFDHVRPQSPGGWRDFRVMVLNIETGEIRELVDPRAIDGASGLRLPDY